MSGVGLADLTCFQRRTGILENDFDTINETPIFSACRREQLVETLADSAVQEFPRNALIFMQDDAANRFYVVLSGWVKVFRETIDGRESVLHVFGPGESFAEAVVFREDGYPACAAACVDVRLLGIPTRSFRKRLAKNQRLAENFMNSVSAKLCRMGGQIEQLVARSATERLAGYLFSLCPETTEAAVVRLPLDKAVIAAKLGMQPETFSRSLSKLRSVGVRIDGNTVSIPNVCALLRLSEGDKPFETPARVGTGPYA
jgi:CRP-like cAMP-binding protein